MHYIELENDVLDRIVYRGEGNSSIVIALKTEAKVIRLLKRDAKLLKFSQDHHHVAQHPIQSIKFIHLIMKPLTDPFSNSATELVRLKSDFVYKLSKIVESHRPQNRLDKTLLMGDQFALIMDDLCSLPVRLTRELAPDHLCGPTISVEIKPKQGFLPIYKHAMKSVTNDQFNATKLRGCCLYSSAQYLKLSHGLISQISEYCPINLFSGCPIKMKNALEELILNPQNNLRIFKDRNLTYDESQQVKLSSIFGNFFGPIDDKSSRSNQMNFTASNEERFVDLLIQCLLNDNDEPDSEIKSSSVDNENSPSTSIDSCLQHLAKIKCKRCDIMNSSFSRRYKSTKISNHPIHKLPKSCVLSSILQAQKLDSIGAHEAMNMLEWLLDHQRNLNSEQKLDIIEELSRPKVPIGFGSIHRLPHESTQQFYFRKVWEFLVSLTAKDCSIIVTLRRISTGSYESIVSKKPDIRVNLLKESRTGNYYMFNVGIADLDQKMPIKIARIRDKLNLILQLREDLFKIDPSTLQRRSNV